MSRNEINRFIKTKRGFTLIELMVVVSVIAVLSIVGVAVYANVLKNSRNAKRLADLKFIQSALEDYHADQLYYPASVIPGNTIVFGTKVYLPKIPTDPLSSNPQYNYQKFPSTCSNPTPTCTSYCLFIKFEGSNIPVSDTGCTSYPSGGYNYGVTRP